MAKFIIEVSDDYIRERSKIENIIESNSESKLNDGHRCMKSIVEIVTFTGLSKCLDDDVNEFYLSSKDIDENGLPIFNDMMLDICSLTLRNELQKKEMG